MISFDLKCDSSHGFEGWFRSTSDYEEQLARGLLACPLCGSTNISKMLSTPNIARKGSQQPDGNRLSETESADNSVTLPTPAAAPKDTAQIANMPEMPQQLQQALEKVAEIQKEALKESKWVGREFAEEARAIHYGETEKRLIHGETSQQEAKELAEEGVPVAPLLVPHVPPEAKN